MKSNHHNRFSIKFFSRLLQEAFILYTETCICKILKSISTQSTKKYIYIYIYVHIIIVVIIIIVSKTPRWGHWGTAFASFTPRFHRREPLRSEGNLVTCPLLSVDGFLKKTLKIWRRLKVLPNQWWRQNPSDLDFKMSLIGFLSLQIIFFCLFSGSKFFELQGFHPLTVICIFQQITQ